MSVFMASTEILNSKYCTDVETLQRPLWTETVICDQFDLHLSLQPYKKGRSLLMLLFYSLSLKHVTWKKRSQHAR